MPADLPDSEIDAIKQLIFAGRKIEAIKEYRQATGTDLKHAKDVIEALTDRLRQESPEKFGPELSPGSQRGLLLIIGLVAIGMAIFALVSWIGARPPH